VEEAMSAERQDVIELPPDFYDAKGRSGHASYVCSQLLVTTYREGRDGIDVQVRHHRGNAVYAHDKPRLFDLIRAYDAIIVLIKEEMR
jgi:hypothetical protein